MKVRARAALDGLSVGDAFGERFFLTSPEAVRYVRARRVPPFPEGPWRWTDDTQMALAIDDVLEAHGAIDQDALAERFAARFDPKRNYGEGAFHLLERIRGGTPWR